MSKSNEAERIARFGKSIFDRGLTAGTSGNISVKVADGWLMTPTNSSLGELDPSTMSRLSFDGKLVAGHQPTKEAFLHRAMYDMRADCAAVVHLHSTHSVAVSCLADIDPHNVLPPITAYYAMKIGTLPLIPYFKPGDLKLADAVRALAGKHHAVLLANHGPVVAGTSLDAAVAAMEELEETAKLFLLLDGHRVRHLTPQQLEELGVKQA
ncbi:MAG TPA: 3-oxo-tetronate 4-phosphate decarboxylase [Pseudolabrys sp.]|jgi:ribulose-5-phosphate 4-epimerase/fuculose-1-phosphate aldolase|nr:3-oxo-tetronate 4-phosphate decarboxylase [Pseudolabrys sp.]